MPDGSLHTQDVEETVEFTIRVACECYCSLDLARDALSQQPLMNGALAWGIPRIPDSDEPSRDVDLVFIVADQDSLRSAMGRADIYKQAGRQNPSHLLIYLRDEEDVSAAKVSGWVLPRAQLASGLSGLTRAVLEPVIPHGLVCVDWADTRHILDMEGQVVIEEASGSRLEDAIESLIEKLRQHATGRAIQGMQASIVYNTAKLAMRNVHEFISACKQETDEDATIILAAPVLDVPEEAGYELRLFARIEND